MSATQSTLNGIACTRVRLLHPWKGAWVADVELDVSTPATAPSSGPATLVAGGVTMTGTVDPRASGTFGSKASARVVGGGGAWDRIVAPQDFTNDTGVSSTTVYQQTAGLVGETLRDLAPQTLGTHFVRYGGPASLVFALVDWWVDALGVTNVGPRPTATPDASLVLRDFDAGQQRVEFACDSLLYPNTALSDPRFNGASPIVRDVEQVFDESGSHGVAWCAAQPVSRLLGALTNAIRQLGGTVFLRAQRYRLSLYQGDRLALQAVNPSQGMPDIVPLSSWAGVPGFKGTLAPGQEVLLGFDYTDPANPQPILLAYSGAGLPLGATYDASEQVQVGPSAEQVQLAGGTGALVLAEPYGELLAALASFAAAISPSAPVPPLDPIVSAAGGALVTALGLLPAPATTKTVAA